MGLAHVTVSLKADRRTKKKAEPILGVTALESVGILVDAARQTLKRMPAIPLK